jgi:hypothetical protein
MYHVQQIAVSSGGGDAELPQLSCASNIQTERPRLTTPFTVNPVPVDGAADVTIATELPVRTGVLGAIERALITRFLRRIYVRELALLAACSDGNQK